MKRGNNYVWTRTIGNKKIGSVRLFDMEDIYLSNCLDYVYRQVRSDGKYIKDSITGYMWIRSIKNELKWRHTSKKTSGCDSIWR
jgi:hypothetical protein